MEAGSSDCMWTKESRGPNFSRGLKQEAHKLLEGVCLCVYVHTHTYKENIYLKFPQSVYCGSLCIVRLG